jgi:hypothetical protein
MLFVLINSCNFNIESDCPDQFTLNDLPDKWEEYYVDVQNFLSRNFEMIVNECKTGFYDYREIGKLIEDLPKKDKAILFNQWDVMKITMALI